MTISTYSTHFYVDIVTLGGVIISVYNVQIIKYPTGYQLRYYSRPVENFISDPEDTLSLNDDDYNFSSDGSSLACAASPDDISSDDKKSHSDYVSRSRSINRIYDLARSNLWSFFLTLTVDPKKYDNTIDNYDSFTRSIKKYFNNLKYRYAPDLKYLIVPELHKDRKKLHFHALISDVGSIKFIFSGKVSVGSYIYDYDVCSWGKKIYNMPLWKYGFSTATEVTDSSKCASYISKYITKDLCISLPHKHRYWASLNLESSSQRVYFISHDEFDKFIFNHMDKINYSKVMEVFETQSTIHYYEFADDFPLDDFFN